MFIARDMLLACKFISHGSTLYDVGEERKNKETSSAICLTSVRAIIIYPQKSLLVMLSQSANGDAVVVKLTVSHQITPKAIHGHLFSINKAGRKTIYQINCAKCQQQQQGNN